MQRTSSKVTVIHPALPVGILPTGPISSSIAAGCVVNNTEVELLDPGGRVIASPGATSTYVGPVASILGFPVVGMLSATIVSPPAGIPDLSAPVAWVFTPGTFGISWRLRYYIEQPIGVSCTP